IASSRFVAFRGVLRVAPGIRQMEHARAMPALRATRRGSLDRCDDATVHALEELAHCGPSSLSLETSARGQFCAPSSAVTRSQLGGIVSYRTPAGQFKESLQIPTFAARCPETIHISSGARSWCTERTGGIL